ncbi:hypothetical protein BDQ12DRAFT_409870 [Crucibulum laeve]|uniref:Uncharacterized protein n=1 Tax=Crucibulum laeve TaxID=68775 RepID=A0A5C3LML6_9AGAR|nr:hypothetical protein BDQ12DRAFT_409870 [Crucibulum laeve]
MPSKELNEANNTIKLLEKHLKQYEKERIEMKVESKKCELIKRPNGQAGRASGYNLQSAMGLSENNKLYRVISCVVKRYATDYLRISMTILQQLPGLLEKVIALIQEDIPFFQRFANGWPIKDIIKRYLQNSQMRFKRDMAYISNSFKSTELKGKGKGQQPEANIEDSDNSDSEYDEDDEIDHSEKEDNIMDMGEKFNSTSKNSQEMVVPPKTITGPLTRSNSKNMNKELTIVKPTILPKPKPWLKGRNMKENDPKVKPVIDDNKIEAKKSTLGKWKHNQDFHDYEDNSKQTTKKKRGNEPKALVLCPVYQCKDSLPIDPLSSLKDLISQRAKLIKCDGPAARTVL